jgi:hypothetical protein
MMNRPHPSPERRAAGTVGTPRRRRLLIAVIAVIAVAGLALAISSIVSGGRVDRVEEEQPHRGDLSRRLGIPLPGAPWKLEGRAWGYDVAVAFPDDEGALDQLPPDLREKVEQKRVFRERNIRALEQAAADVEALLGSTALRQTPEYQRSLETVLLSIHASDAAAANPLYRHEPILEQLPSYSKVHLFTPQRHAERVRRRLDELGWSERSHVQPVSNWSREERGIPLRHTTTRWAQDLVEVARDRHGTQHVIAPVTRYQIEDLSRPDNGYLGSLVREDRKLLRVPLFWRGGNILIGEGNNRTLFVGQREIENNRSDWYNAVFSLPQDQAVKDLLQRLTGVAALHVVPNSPHLFHLDLVVTFLAPGVAALIAPLDENVVAPEDRRVIAHLESLLITSGFRIVEIPTVAERIAAYQSPVNIVPFTQRGDQRRRALVPQYPDLSVEHDGTPRSLNELVNQRYRDEGIEVVEIEDRFFSKRGNTHCALSALD